jgi:hypothetical protein
MSHPENEQSSESRTCFAYRAHSSRLSELTRNKKERKLSPKALNCGYQPLEKFNPLQRITRIDIILCQHLDMPEKELPNQAGAHPHDYTSNNEHNNSQIAQKGTQIPTKGLRFLHFPNLHENIHFQDSVYATILAESCTSTRGVLKRMTLCLPEMENAFKKH